MAKQQTITQVMEKINEEICDDYCRWPLAYRLDYDDPDQAHEHMLEDKCVDCPLSRI